VNTQHRYATLDGLRGFAAVAVMLYHGGHRSPLFMAGGYMAVDLFFALSGFVLARTYDDRLRAGLSLGQFARLRLIRIYPMFLLGMALGLAFWPGKAAALLMIPDFASGGGQLFPANVAMWSLLFELLANLAFAAWGQRIGWRWLAAIMGLSGALVIIGTMAGHDADLGAFARTAGFGLARTAFAFSLGVGISRFQAAQRPVVRQKTALAWLLFPILLAILAFAPAQRTAWDLASILLFLPAILWLGTRWDMAAPGLVEWLGNLSFPLYCIHQPIIAMFRDSPALILPVSLLLLGVASVLDRRLDQPLRRWLMTGLKRQAAARRISPAT